MNILEVNLDEKLGYAVTDAMADCMKRTKDHAVVLFSTATSLSCVISATADKTGINSQDIAETVYRFIKTCVADLESESTTMN